MSSGDSVSLTLDLCRPRADFSRLYLSQGPLLDCIFYCLVILVFVYPFELLGTSRHLYSLVHIPLDPLAYVPHSTPVLTSLQHLCHWPLRFISVDACARAGSAFRASSERVRCRSFFAIWHLRLRPAPCARVSGSSHPRSAVPHLHRTCASWRSIPLTLLACSLPSQSPSLAPISRSPLVLVCRFSSLST